MSTFRLSQRPKSCSKNAIESRRSLRQHQSIEDELPCCPEMPPKRTNSLQNLNVVRREQRKLTHKPPKLAWIPKIISDESPNYVTYDRSTVNSFEPFRKSERKSIDIFLSRGFVNQNEILPSQKKNNLPKVIDSVVKRKLENMEQSFGTFTSAFDFTTDDEHSAFSSKSEIPDYELPEQFRNEKKVTFSVETVKSKTLSAETRRHYFRNRHSKFSKNTSLFTPAEKSSDTKSTSATSSATSNERLEAETRPRIFLSPSITKQVSIDKQKETTTKRRLKSCRSRTFHKSLDNSSVYQTITETLPFVKPLKTNPEIETMVSLINGEEKKNDDSENAETVSSDEIAKDTKLEGTDDELRPMKQFKNGILKANLSKDDNQLSTQQAIQRSKLLITSMSYVGLDKFNNSRFTCNTLNTKNFENSRHHNINTNFSDKIQDSENDKTEQNNNSESNIKNEETLQFQKEKECWSSFHKMANKGLFVSFDTILRGLLTPTEYRLRKHELLD